MARMFTVNEAADYLRVTPYTIRKWIRRGRIRGNKMGRVYRILEADLEMTLGLSEQRPVPEARRLRAIDLVGSCADVLFTTADLAREHEQEIERDESRYREHFGA